MIVFFWSSRRRAISSAIRRAALFQHAVAFISTRYNTKRFYGRRCCRCVIELTRIPSSSRVVTRPVKRLRKKAPGRLVCRSIPLLLATSRSIYSLASVGTGIPFVSRCARPSCACFIVRAARNRARFLIARRGAMFIMHYIWIWIKRRAAG